MSADFRARRAAFRKLHESGCFAIPNPWDAGSALYLQHLGFKALATTSSGFALTRGLVDGAVSRETMVAHLADIAEAVEVPVNADFMSCYSATVEGVGESVRMAVATGISGLSIEDSTGVKERPLYEIAEAVERVRAARAAIDASGTGVMLTARAEVYLVEEAHRVKEAIRRLQAYAQAGADVLFAPGIRDREGIAAIVAAVRPKPVNVLMSANTGLRMADLAALGVRRVSVGSGLARAAWTGFMKAAKILADEGSFAGFDGTVAYTELSGFLKG